MSDAAMLVTATPEACLRLRRDCALGDDPHRPATVRLSHAAGSACLGELTRGRREALHALAAGPCSELELSRMVSASDGESSILAWQMLLRRLDVQGMLEHGLHLDGRLLATLRPIGRGPVIRRPSPDPAAPVKLSRFVTIRPADGQLLAQSPRSHLGVELAAELTGLLGLLADWRRPCDVAGEVAHVSVSVVSAVIGLLADANLLTIGGPTRDPETTQPALAQWSAPDLWLHARSRGPLLGTGYGGTYPLAGRFPPLSAVPAGVGGALIALPRPDLAAISKTEGSLTDVLERRRSIREHDTTAPITVEQLGELLYRSVRTTAVFTDHGLELSSRPYPCGGSLHELEIYPVVSSCTGVEPGLWHYATTRHSLERLHGPTEAASMLVEAARKSCLMSSPPQVLLVIAARFGRVLWKYEGMGYALILKHVGVLYQTLYLVATSMGLAACGLGGGDAETFAVATGLDYAAEGSVGEFVVGSRPQTPCGGVHG